MSKAVLADMVNSSTQPSSEKSVILHHTRTTKFLDRSSDEDSTPTPRQPNGGSNGTPNAEASSSKRKLPSQTDGAPKKKHVRGEYNDESRRKRKEVADKLFIGRQELPFYQGVLGPTCATIVAYSYAGRKMILQEIMAHDTTIVCPIICSGY